MKHPPKNIVQSIHDRLKNKSEERDETFNFLLIRYGLERLIHRLAISEYSDQFILKGALLFEVWTQEPHRSTKDIDFTISMSKNIPELEHIFRDLCEISPTQIDGLVYLPDSVRGQTIRDSQKHGGIRIKMMARLGNARIPLQIDIGFGDTIIPKPVDIKYPSLLDMESSPIKGYRQETTIAEKFQSMVSKGIANSRMKDYYDIFYLSHLFTFKGNAIKSAIIATFNERNTNIPVKTPLALSNEFSNDPDKQKQWEAFQSKVNPLMNDINLESVVPRLESFLMPATQAALKDSSFHFKWDPNQTEWTPK